MRKLTALILFLIIAILGLGQENKYSTVDSMNINNSGIKLIKSSNSLFAGLILSGIGSALIIKSSSDTNKSDPRINKQNKNVGTVCVILGAVLHIHGIILIGEAGRNLNKPRKELTYVVSPTEVGLALNF